ncbi:MAG: GspE/PulE family protein [Planctomycetaceae bacterium]|nr:type II/IV secretion system protein [Planctomycetaceae bacterium]
MSETTPSSDTHSRHRALQEELKELADVVGPVPLVDLLLERAFEVAATDIHFDPNPEGLVVRLRVDGILHNVLSMNSSIAPQVISRLKLLGGMDITERRFMQDGHISNSALRSQRDIRVGSGPTLHGERVVLRLMPASESYSGIEELGFEENQLASVEHAIRIPHGMVLSVGPVGAGKSTTTYSFLNRLNIPGKSVVTIEDPVERRIDRAVQIQTDNKIQFGFVEALRGCLRQDPNVIMVGEIRDSETAHIAARAALTGIQVLSTLHAHDTGSTIDVFREFGVPSMFIADSISCIIAQRLLRMVCSKHRETYQPDAATLKILGLNPDECGDMELVRGVPHADNFGTGYSGRTGIFEVLTIDDEIRQAILDGHSSKELTNLAVQHGLQSLEQSAVKKVLAGVTTVEEMHRVLL